MNRTDKIILVTGATGRQGGATARHLLAAGWHVRALSRAPNKPAAQALRQAGAEVVQGDNDDKASLEAAMQGIYGVFSVPPPIGYDDEVRQGKNVADAAREASVQHFVYTSIGGAENQSRFRKLGKWEVEQYIRALGLKASILRPTWFMEDLVSQSYGALSRVFVNGTLATPIKPDVEIHLISVGDIGAFVALAFDQPDSYLGKTIEIAGDALTPPQIAAAISRATGRSIPYVQIPIETLRQQNADVARVYDIINELGFSKADIPALRKLHPGLMDFDTWLKSVDKAKFEAKLSAPHT